MVIALSILLLLFYPSSSLATQALSVAENPVSVISEIREIKVRQIGGDKVLIELGGRAIRPPQFVFDNESAAVLELQKTDMTKAFIDGGAKRREWWELNYDYPLARRINFIQTGDKTITMRITGDSPLWLKDIRGGNGSDSMTLLLQTLTPPTPKQGIIAVQTPKNLLERKEKISLDMRGIFPAVAFHMFAAIIGMNFVAAEAIPTKGIDLSFRDAPFGEAFGSLLGITGLVHAVRGNTLIIGSAPAVAEIIGGYEIRAYRIAYGDISKAAVLVTEMVAYLKKTVVDEDARTLYVAGTATQHQEVAALLCQLDSPGRQVVLEARLIEVNKSARQEIETMFSAVYREWIISCGLSGVALKHGLANQATQVRDGVGAINGELGHSLKLLDAGLRAMESERKGKILASPSIAALDGKKAVIKLTRNYLYQSSVDSKGNAKFTEQETGPSLEITPLIGRDGVLTLNLKISSGEIIGFHKSGTSEAPETSRREVETCVRVRDGEPFVIGGLYAESKNNSVVRMPILGYLPLLGELFTTRTEASVSSELAFIVVPRILEVP